MKLKKRWPAKRLSLYAGAIAVALLIAIAASWTAFAARIDNYAYDFIFNLYPASWQPQSVVVAIDEPTFHEMGGTRGIRTIIARALELVAPAQPKVVGVDAILADAVDPEIDGRLEAAMRAIPKLVLDCEVLPSGWELPLPRFVKAAGAVGHIHSEALHTGELPFDGVSRSIPLEVTAFHERRWALALEMLRLARGANSILESPEDLDVGGLPIPAPRLAGARLMWIRFIRSGIPTISVAELAHDPAKAGLLRGKAVFVGVTALTAARDRLRDPYKQSVPGVEIHAQAYETMARGAFLQPASDRRVLFVCGLLSLAAALVFGWFQGWGAYAGGFLLIVVAHTIPAWFFNQGIIFPYSASISAAWLSLVTAAAFQYFVTRRALRQSESDKARYQQAIHFVTHEMRTPLTAIQGSSELMGRYNLNEDKRKQMAQMIHSESKRLARMIQTFLDVERLSEGQMEMKRGLFAAGETVESCVERVRPLAERKQIQVFVDALDLGTVNGDRELMEYAVYNLLTNAVKYSPAGTEVHIEGVRAGEQLRLSVRDQGIGMDAKELRNVFKKFYRTKKAEASGEAGTGIGLSIVEQIVTHHGGRMEVVSAPGKGSTFTMILPAPVTAPAK